MPTSPSTTIDTRRHQAFPTLSAGEIDRLRAFGTVRRYASGDHLFRRGEADHGLSVDDAWKYFCLGVLNLNEFVYLD